MILAAARTGRALMALDRNPVVSKIAEEAGLHVAGQPGRGVSHANSSFGTEIYSALRMAKTRGSPLHERVEAAATANSILAEPRLRADAGLPLVCPAYRLPPVRRTSLPQRNAGRNRSKKPSANKGALR